MWDYNQNWKPVCPDIFLFLAREKYINMLQIIISTGLSRDLTQSPTLHSSQLTRSEVFTSAANRLIGEDVQSRRRPLLGPSPG